MARGWINGRNQGCRTRIFVYTLALGSPHFNLDRRVFTEMAIPEQTFEQWLEAIGGITENGRSKIEKATIVNLAAVRLISEEDIDEIRLGLGDRVIFKAGWRALIGDTAAAAKASDDSNSRDPPRTEDPPSFRQSTSHYTVSEFTELLKLLPSSAPSAPASPSPRGLQQSQAARSFGDPTARVTAQSLSKNQALRELAASLGQPPPAEQLSLDHYSPDQDDKGEKCLLPINFATVIGGFVSEEEEVLSTGEFGGRMVWQAGRKNSRKPTPDRLNYGQFYEASARILKEIN
jgi:hypothetical protein